MYSVLDSQIKMIDDNNKNSPDLTNLTCSFLKCRGAPWNDSACMSRMTRTVGSMKFFIEVIV